MQKKENTREGKRAASRKEKREEGREEPQVIERLGVGLAGWLCSCVRTSCGMRSHEKIISEKGEVQTREDKRSEEGSEQNRKDGEGREGPRRLER